jgi:hypothetical protein
LSFRVTLFSPAHVEQIQEGKQEKRRQCERGIGEKRDDQYNPRRQLDETERPAPAMSVGRTAKTSPAMAVTIEKIYAVPAVKHPTPA